MKFFVGFLVVFIAFSLFPAAGAESTPGKGELRIRAGKEFQPIRPVRRIKPGSALDFSRFLDAPAGKYGFVRAVNGRLEFSGRPGHEFRFYGSNLCFSANFPEHATAVQIAEEFASTGYNIVRFHHYDNQLASRKAGTVLDPEMLDRMEFLMAEMKKRGIYSTIDLYVSRRFRPGEIAALPAGGSGGNAKGMIFFDDEAFENWKCFSEALLTHVNPYTGLAWKDDPALISISLVNEDTIYLAANAKYVKPLVAERFQEYVKKNRITLTDENHRRMKLKFLSEVYRARYAQMREFLRELGIRVPLTDQNSYASLPLALMGEEYDLIDTHTYAGHPKFLNGGWTPPAQIMPGSILAVCGDEFPRKGAQRIFGKPLTVTEWDEPSPNLCEVEASPIISAYAAMQGWSGLCRFAYSHGSQPVEQDYPMSFFDTVRNPLRALSERIGVLFFLRGDVKESEVEFPLILRRDYLDHPGYREKNNGYESSIPELYGDLGLLGKTGILIADPEQGVKPPPRAAVVLAARPHRGDPAGTLAADGAESAAEIARRFPAQFDPARGRFGSLTGEIMLDSHARTFLVRTRRSECFVLPSGHELRGAFASVENRRGPVTILVASLDDRPLEASGRILILHLTGIQNTDMIFRDETRSVLESWGTLPLLMHDGESAITLAGVSPSARLNMLDWSGEVIGSIPLEAVPGGSRFTACSFSDGRAVAAYELIR